jgi:hypothetical protein
MTLEPETRIFILIKMTASLAKKIALPFATAAVLSSATATASVARGLSLNETTHETGSATTSAELVPSILHHWPTVTSKVAGLEPAILHHWPTATTRVAGLFPDILHHWPASTVRVAALFPDIPHHWPTVSPQMAGVTPDILHHWPTSAVKVASLFPDILHHWPTVAGGASPGTMEPTRTA